MQDRFLKNPLLIITIFGLLVYCNLVFNQFVLDDPSQILNNPAVHSIQNIPSLFLGSSFGGGKNLEGLYYKPVMTTVYALLYTTFGPNPFYFHLLQVLLHIANALFVFVLLSKFFNRAISLFLGLIFLVHPMIAEAVEYISNLQDVLFLFFGLLAFLIITKPAIKIKHYVSFGFLLFLSFLSKETGITFLALSLMYIYLFGKRRKPFLIVALTTFALYATLRHFAVGSTLYTTELFPITRLSFPERLMHIPIIIFYYIKTFFFPIHVAIAQQWTIKSLNFHDFYFPLVFDGLFFGILFFFGKKIWEKKRELFKTFVFFTLWFLMGLGIHLQIIPLDATVADRWFYFPSIGILGILGIAVTHMQVKKQKTILGLIGVTVILALSIRTVVRNTNWKDGLTLARHDIEVNKDSFALENNLGFELMQVGRYDQAQIHVEKSIQLVGYWWLSWNNLGVIYRHKAAKTKDAVYLKKAQDSFQKAVDNTNNFYLPYENLAELLLNFKTPQETIVFIQQASKKISVNSHLFFTLALAQYQLDNTQAALDAAKASYELDPTNNLSYQLYQALLTNKQIQIKTPDY